MGYLGNVRPTIALVADDITDGAITAAKIAADAVTSAKIGADQIGSSELNLGANYAFTGTVTGAGGGKILQVVMDSSTTAESTTSTSFVASALSVSITPSSTASKILVLCSCDARNTIGSNKATWYGISKGGTILGDSDGIVRIESSGGAIACPLAMSILDSPSTTSATTYALSHKVESGGTSSLMWGSSYGSIIAMEIGA